MCQTHKTHRTVPLIFDILVPSQNAQFYRNSSKKWLYLRAKSICHSEAVDAPLFFGLPGILLSPAILSCISFMVDQYNKTDSYYIF